MPTGPFAALGTWNVFEHDGSIPKTGAAPKLTIVKATKKWIKYQRKCHDSAEDLHHGKVYRWDAHTFRVSVGNFQHIQAQVKLKHQKLSMHDSPNSHTETIINDRVV